MVTSARSRILPSMRLSAVLVLTSGALIASAASALTATPTAQETPTVTDTPPASPTPTPTCLPLPCPFGQVPYCPGCPEGCGTECVTPTPVSNCPGDCNGDGSVTIDELLRAVNLALGSGIAGATCSALDTNRDGTVSIAEVVRAVGAALIGCPPLWLRIGPRSMDVVAVAVDPSDSKVMYATVIGVTGAGWPRAHGSRIFGRRFSSSSTEQCSRFRGT
jgi:hypothetical protein